MKVISFSIWGTNPTYTVGAVRNADLALQLLPEWTCVFYCWDSVPLDIVEQLESRPNVIVRRVEGDYDPSDSRGMFHRFYPADEIGVERMICRDTNEHTNTQQAHTHTHSHTPATGCQRKQYQTTLTQSPRSVCIFQYIQSVFYCKN